MKRPHTSAGPLRLLYPSEYNSWVSMIARCYTPSSTSYPRYGAKGVRVNKRWHTFANFVDDMGPRPAGLTLERIRNGEGYHADNCQWATKKAQGRNRWDNHRVKYLGRTQCLSAWCEELGIEHHTLQKRLARGWTVAKSLGTRVRERAGSASSSAAPAGLPSPRTRPGLGATAEEVQAWLAG